jgi:hypothetical protein
MLRGVADQLGPSATVRQALSYNTSMDVIFTVYSATSGEPPALALRRLARMNWP